MKYYPRKFGDEPDFRMSGCHPVQVKLALTMRARNLLVEEYPLAEERISEVNGRWIYEGTVRSLEGVGRFVMGLMDQVEILQGEALRQFVLEKCRGLEGRFSRPLER